MFTARQVLEAALTEVNKVKAPSLILKDYNYLINKAIQQFINMKVNFYDMNQQIDDDLNTIRVVDSPIALSLPPSIRYYRGTLPSDYLHILNCGVKFNVVNSFSCYNVGDTFERAAGRLVSSPAKRIEENYYFKPSYKNPYFYRNATYLEIRSGSTASAVPSIAYIDYLRKPQVITLTQSQVEAVSDTSQTLEFPDYVVEEIINILVKLLLENSMDPRLQSNIPINQTIANPGAPQSR